MQPLPGNWPAQSAALAPSGPDFLHAARSVKDIVADYLIDSITCCPWPATSGSVTVAPHMTARTQRPLYTAEERRRRDATPWTMVQGVLAPIQFAIFLVSLGLVLNYLATGRGYEVATASIILKTVVLYVIMLTGSIWEKKVFDKFLFARAFFWEDVVSMLVLALHTTYLALLISGTGSVHGLMLLALAAYGTYALNAAQFVLKLRAARLQAADAGPVRFAAGNAK